MIAILTLTALAVAAQGRTIPEQLAEHGQNLVQSRESLQVCGRGSSRGGSKAAAFHCARSLFQRSPERVQVRACGARLAQLGIEPAISC